MADKQRLRRRKWTSAEEAILIKIWESKINALRTLHRRTHIYEEMLLELEKYNIVTFRGEVQVKLQNLAAKYKREKETAKAAGLESEWRFYRKVGSILCRLRLQNTESKIDDAGGSQKQCDLKKAASVASISSAAASPISNSEQHDSNQSRYLHSQPIVKTEDKQPPLPLPIPILKEDDNNASSNANAPTDTDIKVEDSEMLLHSEATSAAAHNTSLSNYCETEPFDIEAFQRINANKRVACKRESTSDKPKPKESDLRKFFSCLVDTIEKFSTHNQHKAKSRIFEIVSELEYEEICAKSTASGNNLNSQRTRNSN